MSIQTVDLTVLLFFLVIFVLISKFKNYLKEEDEIGFKQLSVGMSMLAIAALIRTFGSTGLFGTVPFLSDESAINILLWIVVISGIILLSSGLSSWLPLAQTYRKFKIAKVEKLGTFKRLEQLIRVESRLNPLLERTVEHINASHNLTNTAALLFGTSANQKQVVALAKDSILTKEQIMQIEFEMISRSRGRNEIRIRENGQNFELPSIVATISVLGKPVGLILGWLSEETNDKLESKRDIKLIADILSRKIEHDVSKMTVNLHKKITHAKNQIRHTLVKCNDMRTFLPELKSILAPSVNFEILSISITNSGASDVRYSIGSNGAVLEEIGLASEFSVSNNQTVLSVPLLSVSGQIGALSICSTTFKSSKDKSLLHGIADVVADFVNSQISIEHGKRRQKVTNILRQIQSDLSKEFELKTIYTRVANMLVKEVGVDMVRISSLGDDENFLHSRTLRLGRQLNLSVPETGMLVRSLMPMAESVIATGRDMVVDSNSGLNLSSAEKSQLLFAKVNSSMIIPLKKNQKVRGLIAIGMMNSSPISEDLKQIMISSVTLLESAILTRKLHASSVVGMPLVVRRGPESVETEVPNTEQRVDRMRNSTIKQFGDENELLTLIEPSEIISRSTRVTKSLVAEKSW